MLLTTILVEDSATIRETLIPAMRDLGRLRVVATAETADAAQNAMVNNPGWQVLVVDLFLQHGSGLEVVRAVMDRSHSQKVVVLSNYATDEIRERCAALGVDAVFDKSAALDMFFEYCSSLAR